MGKAMDNFTKNTWSNNDRDGPFMVLKTQPLMALALKETVLPSTIDWTTILTLVGGTVGGYTGLCGRLPHNRCGDNGNGKPS